MAEGTAAWYIIFVFSLPLVGFYVVVFVEAHALVGVVGGRSGLRGCHDSRVRSESDLFARSQWLWERGRRVVVVENVWGRCWGGKVGGKGGKRRKRRRRRWKTGGRKSSV